MRVNCSEGDTLTLSNDNVASSTNILLIAYLDSQDNVLSRTVKGSSDKFVTATAPSNTACAICSFYTWAEVSKAQLEVGTTATAYEPYHASVEEYCVSKQDLKDTIGWGNKNLLPKFNNAVTLYGITYTPQDDGSVIANGTSNNWATTPWLLNFPLKAGTYTLSGSPSVGGTYISVVIGSNTYSSIGGSNVTFTLETDTIVDAIRLSVRTDTTVTNAVFKPQLEKGTVATEYEPYHTSVNQTLRNAEVIKGKNLIGWKMGYVYSSTDGSLSPNTHGVCSDKIKVTAGQKFIGRKKAALGTNDGMFARTYDANGAFVGTIIVLTNTQLRNEITIPANIGYIGAFQLRNSADVSREWLDSNEIMFYDASETDSTYEPYYVPLKDSLDDKVSYADNGVLGAKNLNATKYISGTGAFDVEFTQMDDGGINVSGSIASDTDISDMSVETFTAKRSEAVIASANSTSPKLVAFLYDVTASSRATVDITFGEVTTNLIKDHVYRFRVRAVGVCSLNNDKIYPMLRLASDTDRTYRPYAQTNRELTVNKADTSTIAPTENGSTVQKSGGYTVGSHAIRNRQFITWKNAKAQGETINDASDYTSGDVADELTPITKTFTPASGITATDTKVYMYGALKYLYLNVSGLTIAAETNTQIGQVSADIKPASTIRTALINQDGDIIVSCSIFSNGNVWIKSKTALSNVTLIGSLMWI